MNKTQYNNLFDEILKRNDFNGELLCQIYFDIAIRKFFGLNNNSACKVVNFSFELNKLVYHLETKKSILKEFSLLHFGGLHLQNEFVQMRNREMSLSY
jgi:hypothetical protein